MRDSPPPSALYERLAGIIAPRQRVMTAFSGGVDSTVVAWVARQVLGRDQAPAVVGDSASLPRRELEQVRTLAEQLDLWLIEIQPGEQADADYQRNRGDRCFFCKTHLYAAMHRLAASLQIDWLANGTNADDPGDHRPGLRAADQAQVISPLLEAELGKADVRALAHHLNLPNADKPAAACLASRLPYGTPVTAARLAQVEQAENWLGDLGFTGFRVRHHDTIARLELPWEQVAHLMRDDIRQQVIAGLKQVGYAYVALDLEGFRSGSGNVLLSVEGAQMV